MPRSRRSRATRSATTSARSVLPRLAVEGWILETSASDWDPVQPRVAWWGAELEDRQAIYAALLSAARRAAQRTKPPTPQRASTSVLEGVNLAKSFKGRRVVNQVSVRVEQGEIVGLLGPNGAGKTTTFYIIVGLIQPGRRARCGSTALDITRMPMYKRARARDRLPLAGAVDLPEAVGRGQHPGDPRDAADLGRERAARASWRRCSTSWAIKHLRQSKAYSLSGGERRRLEITRALVTEPKFMMLDEPFAGVDPIAVHDIQTIVAGLRHRGIGVLITDHNVEQTLDIVDRAYIMFEGKVKAAGTVRELVFDDRVAEIYLGPTLTARLRARSGVQVRMRTGLSQHTSSGRS